MLKKIVVVGSSGSGKTTLARKLSNTLSIKTYDLDDIYWLPDWIKRPEDKLVEDLKKIVEGSSWIISGNLTSYSKRLVWSKADLVIWLDIPLYKLLTRTTLRSIKNIKNKTVICNGNYETVRLFFSRNSILIWVLTRYWRRKKQYKGLFRSK